ncbi:hypothetical protein DXG01_017020 [Tephrocybe rancida]|nr:hypothetical protein DXG01_017020 [Tephrocybe rancida]
MSDKGAIRAIDKTSVHRITSGQVVIDLQTAVKELVENSLDAGATNIEVRFKQHGLKSIEVIDNGSGIPEQYHDSIALKHYTSKLSSFSDLATVRTFGFRGEALSSLCALSETLVVNTTTEPPMGVSLEMDASGKVRKKSKIARQRGTTVAMTNLFKPLPVRRKEFERNVKREFGKALALLNAYALIGDGVRLSASNTLDKGYVILTVSKLALTARAVSELWGPKALENIVELDLTFDVERDKGSLKRVQSHGGDLDPITVKVKGLISKFSVGGGRTGTDRQFFYVNGRPCNLNKVKVNGFPESTIQKSFNEVYRSFNANQAPFILADFIIPTDSCDINVSPDKRTIFLHNENNMISTLKTALEVAFAPSRSTYDIGHSQIQREVIQTTLPTRSSTQKRTRASPEEPVDPENGTVNLDEESGPRKKRAARRSSSPTTVGRGSETEEQEEVASSGPHHESSVPARMPSRKRTRSEAEEPVGADDDDEESGPSKKRAARRSSSPPGDDGGANSAKATCAIRRSPSPARVDECANGEEEEATSSQSHRGFPVSHVGGKVVAEKPSSPTVSQMVGDHSMGSGCAPPHAAPRTSSQHTSLTSDRPADVADATSAHTRDADEAPEHSTDLDEAPIVLDTTTAVWNCITPAEQGVGRQNAGISDSSSGDSQAERESGHKAMVASNKTRRDALRSRLNSFARSGSQIPKVAIGGSADGEQEEDEPWEDAPHTDEQTDGEDQLDSVDDCLPAQPPPPLVSKPNDKSRRSIRPSSPVDGDIDTNNGQSSSTAIDPTSEDGFDDSLLNIMSDETSSTLRHERPVSRPEVVRTSDTDTEDITLRFDLTRLTDTWRRLGTETASSLDVGPPPLRRVPSDAGVSNTENDEGAIRALARIIDKKDFSKMDVVGQFNLGFIVTRRRKVVDENDDVSATVMDDLFIVDQHAADEKYNFETLQQTTTINSQKLFKPQMMELTASDELIALENMDMLRQNGFEVEEVEGTNEELRQAGRLRLTAQPVSKSTVFDMKDLEELIHLMRDCPTGQMVRCSKARAMFAMRACRKSVMVGKPLNKQQMTTVVNHMGTMDQPWNCPHGRPTMRHLLDLSDLAVKTRSQKRDTHTDWSKL